MPVESRFIQKYTDSKDWDWDKEVQSRILMMLDIISCQLSNVFRKESQRARVPSEQFQPSYVKKAKIKVEVERRATDAESLAELKAFYGTKNKDAKEL